MPQIMYIQYFPAGATAADPQLQFFENFPGHLGATFVGGQSQNIVSLHAVNIPLSISFNNVVMLHVHNNTRSRTKGISFGLYSMTGSTLSLANSASGSWALSGTASSWISMATSTTQNISPGAWYFAFQQSVNTGGSASSFGVYANSTINPGNAIPGGLLMGRMTASNNGMPASIATSELDITGSDAIKQPLIIITA